MDNPLSPPNRSEFEEQFRKRNQVVVSEPVSFAWDGKQFHTPGTPEYERLRAEALAMQISITVDRRPYAVTDTKYIGLAINCRGDFEITDEGRKVLR